MRQTNTRVAAPRSSPPPIAIRMITKIKKKGKEKYKNQRRNLILTRALSLKPIANVTATL